MNPPLRGRASKQIRLFLFMLLPIVIAAACGTPASPAGPPTGAPSTATPAPATASPTELPATATPAASPAPAEAEVDFGPGPFDFPDTRAGLAELSSYTAALKMSFDGSRDGAANRWAKTYVMRSTREPAALQLTIEKAGDLASLDPVFMAEAEGAVYERRGEGPCSATLLEEGNSLRDRLEPAGFLTFVIGADEGGSETVNDVAATHYTFDERASGQSGLVQSTGEMWVAAQGGYLVRYLLASHGEAGYFGEGIAGTLTLDYELTDINQPITLTLPDDCPAGRVSAPLLPDATDVVDMPGLLAYSTATGPEDVAAFYQDQMPALGWTPAVEPAIDEAAATLEFVQGTQTLSILITGAEAGTQVRILLAKTQEQ